MKKKSLILILAMMLVMVFTACGAEEEVVPEPGTDHTYKDIMVPFDELVPAERIVLLQNTLNFGMQGFYTEETKPVAENISYNGSSVEAYPISYTLDFLTNEVKGDVTVTDADGNETVIPADEFKAMYVIVDFMSADAPVLYNTETGTETTIAAAKTSEGEGIYSIPADSAHNTADIMKACGWTSDETYRLIATDKFYIPIEPEYLEIGELRGTLSGAITASFEGMTIASGKLNDPVYFEKQAEEK